jgi:hypothetical protein
MQQIQRQIIEAGGDEIRLDELYREKTQLSRMLHALK